jgi:hypothetical protein
MALSLLKLTQGGKEYFFRAKAETYEGLESDTGVAVAGDNELDNPAVKIGRLMNNGQAIRVICQGGGADKNKVFRILVARDKAGTALDSLLDKTIPDATGNQVTIKSTRFETKKVRVV